MTKVVPGKYRVGGAPSDATVMVSSRNDPHSFEPGYTYRLRFEPADFPAGEIEVRNQTGQPVTLSLQGPVNRTLQAQAGTSSFQIAPGRYQLHVQAWCGGSERSLTLVGSAREILTYQCH